MISLRAILTRVIFLIFSLDCYSQRVVVSANDYKILYIGYKNKIDFAVEGFTRKQIIGLKIDGGMYYKEKSNDNEKIDKYYVVPDGTKREVNIRFKIKRNDDKIFWTKPVNFFARYIPPPPAFLGTKNDGIIYKEELESVGWIYAGLGDDFAPAYVHYAVQSYNIAIISPEILYFESVQGNKISDKTRKIFDGLTGGETILIYNVSTILIETKFHIKADPVLVRLKSNQPFRPVRDYILSGFININGVDSFFKFRTNTQNKEGIEVLDLGQKDSIWQLRLQGCDSNLQFISKSYNKDIPVWSKEYFPTGELFISKIYGINSKKITYDKNGRLLKTENLNADDLEKE